MREKIDNAKRKGIIVKEILEKAMGDVTRQGGEFSLRKGAGIHLS